MSTSVFPALAGLEYPVTWTPMAGKTLVQTSVSGKENRAALWTYPRRRYTLSYNFLRDDSNNEFRQLVAFFLARQGSYDSFLFNDVDDNSVSTQQIGVGDGTTVQFQLVRPFGGFSEPILAPNVVSNLKVNGVLKTQGVDYGVGVWENGVTPAGTVNFFTGAPGAGQPIMCDFTYYWPCRFLADEYDVDKFMNRLWQQKKLDFITLKS